MTDIIVCISPDRIAFSMTNIGNTLNNFGTFQIALTNTDVRTASDLELQQDGSTKTVQHDILEFSMLPLNNGDRATSPSDSAGTLVQLDLESLKNHQIMGRYMIGDKPDPIALYALQREQTFPRISPSPQLSKDMDEAAFHGVYELTLQKPLRPALTFDAGVGATDYPDLISLTLNLLGDTPIASLGFQHDGNKIRMVDGLPFQKDGTFMQSNGFGENELSSRGLMQIRGRILDDAGTSLELYIIDSTYGVLQGTCPKSAASQDCPLQLTKIAQSNLYFEMPTPALIEAAAKSQPAPLAQAPAVVKTATGKGKTVSIRQKP